MCIGQTRCYCCQSFTLGRHSTLSQVTMFSLFLHFKYLACASGLMCWYFTYIPVPLAAAFGSSVVDLAFTLGSFKKPVLPCITENLAQLLTYL